MVHVYIYILRHEDNSLIHALLIDSLKILGIEEVELNGLEKKKKKKKKKYLRLLKISNLISRREKAWHVLPDRVFRADAYDNVILPNRYYS